MFMNNNPISLKKRSKELFFDYLLILLYLALLFGVSMAVYHLFFKGIPKMNELQSQLIALLTSVIPITLIFSYLDYSKDGSFGKCKAGLKLVYKHKSLKASFNDKRHLGDLLANTQVQNQEELKKEYL